VIGAPDIPDGDRRDAQVGERREQGFEHRPGSGIPLEIDAPDAPGAVVKVEIGRDARVFRLPRAVAGIAEVAADVSDRPGVVVAGLLGVPQGQPDGPPWREIQGAENPERFDRDGTAGGVIRGAAADVQLRGPPSMTT
jgi:hypothetical protein